MFWIKESLCFPLEFSPVPSLEFSLSLLYLSPFLVLSVLDTFNSFSEFNPNSFHCSGPNLRAWQSTQKFYQSQSNSQESEKKNKGCTRGKSTAIIEEQKKAHIQGWEAIRLWLCQQCVNHGRTALWTSLMHINRSLASLAHFVKTYISNLTTNEQQVPIKLY